MKLNSNPNDQSSPCKSGTANQRGRGGVTLVELLVVITILSVIAAILIPQLRVINEDRNIREAARIVASAFSKASARAISEGSAGLMIVPNPNFFGPTSFGYSDSTGVDSPFFGGTRIFQMRRTPPYTGDDENSLAWTTPSTGNQAVINRPFEHDSSATPPRLVIQVNDEISFNGSSYRYRIINVQPNASDPFRLNLTLELPATNIQASAPFPNLGQHRLDDHSSAVPSQPPGGVPYVVHRQPRRLESSLVELPEGYLIDLRYSGPVLGGTFAEFGTHLNQNQAIAGSPANIVLHYDSNGGVERVLFEGVKDYPGASALVSGEPLRVIQPTGSLDWLVTDFDPNGINVATGLYKPGNDPILSPTNKWVTVDHLTGSVNVASGAIPRGTVDLDGDGLSTFADQILESRGVASGRQSTSQ